MLIDKNHWFWICQEYYRQWIRNWIS